MHKIIPTLLILSLLSATVAHAAEEAPPPHRMPRTPVSRETVMEPRDAMPASRQLQGLAAIIDGEKLRIGETDLRLFGIVPPQLSASFGPQARAMLDTLANGQNVTCNIRDRDRDGRLLATCHNAKDADMALELVKHGLAVTARGSIAGTELATPYATAEQTAQNEKIGLWSVTTVAVATPVTVVTPKQESPAADNDTKKEEKKAAEAQTQAKIAADITAQQAQAQAAQTRLDDNAWTDTANMGFFERYQTLIAGLLMLGTALSIIGALWVQKRNERIDELKSIAAALRGELMAARSVCVGRAKTITTDEEDRTATWPRIRATLYQAYVGRLGILGAELARHVASVYGQSSDHAALHAPGGATQDAPKKAALETLAKRIEEILPKLAEIERTGIVPSPSPFRPRMQTNAPIRPAVPASVATSTAPPTAPAGEEVASAVETTETPSNEVAHAFTFIPSANIARAPAALWENMRGFLQGAGSEGETEPTPEQHSEYAAMIEADMARYQYGENIETLDISPKKKQG